MTLRVVVVVALLVAGMAVPAQGVERQPQVVVAVADTGVNPYHEVYYRPGNTAHPCTWVEGFDDCSIPALNLSIGEYSSYEEAVAADQAVWDSVQLHQWYWIPKTNIIGAVCDGGVSISAGTGVCILDDDGHGTGTTSSVLSEAPDALLLVHEGNSGAYDLATAPVVPDIQTHSWGPLAPLPLHAADPVLPGESLFCGDGAFDDETIFFVSAGNEAPVPTIADCDRVNNRVQVVGGGYPGYYTVKSWSLFDFASWYCRPTALYNSTTEMISSYCGTSFSSPTAAGAAAAALLEIRRAEGYVGRSTPDMVSATVSREEFIDALRTAASYTPDNKFPSIATPPAAIPVPAQAPYVLYGYGWLDSTVSDDVVACALGGTCAAKSAEAQEWNARRRAARAATSEDAVPAAPQDDAGSGRDAGTTRQTAVPVEAGRDYDARIEAYGLSGDMEDWFTFTAAAGERITVAVSGLIGCWTLRDPADAELVGSTCGSDGEAVAPADGQYVLTYDYFAPPQDYSFRIDLG